MVAKKDGEHWEKGKSKRARRKKHATKRRNVLSYVKDISKHSKRCRRICKREISKISIRIG
jgi:hypothetical protein